jgi:hypothetical protein
MLILERIIGLFSSEPLCPRFHTKCRRHKCHAYTHRTVVETDKLGNENTHDLWECGEYETQAALTLELVGETQAVRKEILRLHAGVNDFRNHHVNSMHTLGRVTQDTLQQGLARIEQELLDEAST